MTPTIAEVARAAGVSQATVSRALNGKGNVSSERADRVRKVADELGYQPFGPAQALRRQRTRLWAVMIADIENPFFTSVVRGLEDVAQAEDNRLVLCNTDESLDKEAAYLDVVVSERMAGAVVALASTDATPLDRLHDAGIPVVAIDRRPDRDGIDSVVIDNRHGARLATSHLLEEGAARVGCITGPRRISTAEARLDGHRDALAAAGRKLDQRLVRRADFREEGGYRAALGMLSAPDRPDAVFVANNLMTLGVLRAVRELGLRVPDDLTLVGFDDAPWTALLSPALTVVAQPTYQLGREAAQLLATASDMTSARHLVLSPTLVVRESSRRP